MRISSALMMLHFSFLLSGQIDSSMLKIFVDLKSYESSDLEFQFDGCLQITNIGSQKLKLPRYFDLGYYLYDETGNPVPYRNDAIYEYACKVKLDKNRIKPNETFEVRFSEDRLNYEYSIRKNQSYSIQYFLLHKCFSPNIKSDKIIISM